MASHAKIANLLGDLGFCEEASALYLSLLDEGPLSLADLSHQAGVDEKHALPLLGMLIASRLVFEDGGHFWVLNPRKAFKAFADEVLWSVTNTLSDGLDDVPPDHVDQVKKVRELCWRLQSAASELYTHRSPVAVGRIKVARDPVQMAALLAEAIDSAREEILCVSTSPRQPQLSVIWGSLLGRIKDGVRYARVVDLVEFVEHGMAIVQRDVRDIGVELYVTERERIDEKYYVIDDKYAVMFAPDKYDFTLTGQVIGNRMLVRKYRKAFEALLRDAIPATFVLEVMAEQRGELLGRAAQKMSKLGVLWMECLIDFGIYCKFRDLDPSGSASALRIAEQEHLIELTGTDKQMMIPLPRYSWSAAHIRRLWSGANRRDYIYDTCDERVTMR